MASSSIRSLSVVLICLLAFVGCNRSNTAEVTQVKADAEAARSEAQAAKAELAKANARSDAAEGELAKLKAVQAQPKAVDADRRAAEWVLRVDGSGRVVVDGASLELKKGEKLPEGDLKLVSINAWSPKASNDGLDYLRGLKNLREFHFNYDTQITKYDFLAEMPNLERLAWNSRYGNVSDKDLVHLKGLTKLKYLDLGSFFGNESVTDAGLEHLKGMKQLQTLVLTKLNITDAGLQHLKELPDLKVLYLEITKVTDAGLEHLKGLSNLEDLRLQGTKVTEAGVKSLQAALPKCKITLK